jgi:hypothetical protein
VLLFWTDGGKSVVVLDRMVKSYMAVCCYGQENSEESSVVWTGWWRKFINMDRMVERVNVVEPEPQGAGTFGRSGSRNVKVSAPAPGSGSGSA